MIAEELDREKRSSYLLNITVTDHAINPLSASTLLEVILDDGKFDIYIITNIYTVMFSLPKILPIFHLFYIFGLSFLLILGNFYFLTS